MNRLVRTVPRFLALALVVLPAGAAAQEAPSQVPSRYARITGDGVRILNLADDKGVAVATPDAGQLVAVYEESAAGWLLVEVPGGYPVWVFGKFLTATEDQDVFEVTRNAVNIRPGPSSEVTNFPLPQRLHSGDRVRMIETLDASAALADTWARIWSPPGVRAWVRTSATAALAAEEDGAALWNAELAKAGDRVVASQSSPAASSGGAGPGTPDVAETAAASALAAAQGELERERARKAPDYQRVRGLIEAVLTRTPSGTTAIEARETLRRIDALEEATALQAQLEAMRAERAAAATEEQKGIWERSREKDPLGHVFASRGVLFRRRDADGVPTFFLRFGGETVAELACPSGRYDLELFAGFEVGVQGTELASAEGGGTRMLDVSRVEILKRR